MFASGNKLPCIFPVIAKLPTLALPVVTKLPTVAVPVTDAVPPTLKLVVTV